ncbi:MAG: geranylgeranyl reductase family protein [Acidimicrobiia bacterium]|nr:geranylgeranyl reductase family protein [Acidimicrobiia bacterium]
MLEADVAVVGGGPAGAAAAITLARAGRDVVVVDRARFPRDKCCGDGLTAGALRQLEHLGLRPDVVASWRTVDDVWVRSPSGRTACFPMPRDNGVFAAVATRADLDAALLDVARAAGAKVHDGHRLGAARQVDGHVELDVDGLGTVRTPYAVGADGMWSPLRKVLGADQAGYLGEWHAFRQYFRGVGPMATDIWIWFEPDLLPGYAWSFPLPNGRANVGFGIQRSSGMPIARMKDIWPELLQRPHVREVLGPDASSEAPHRAWPIPARVDRARLYSGRALFAGDAAAAADPMTGEGIAQALVTGRLAAAAINGAGPRLPARAADIYERTVRAALVADHRMSALLGRALEHRKGARAAVRIACATAWTRRNFARWLFEDYPRAVLVTPRRWRRGMLTGAGAYART